MFNLDMKKKILIMIVGASIILGVAVVGVMGINSNDNTLAISEEGKKVQESSKQETEDKREKKTPSNNAIYVHVTGAVERPNMYKLDDGARIYDAVMLAKPKKDADLDQVNLAEKLRDQMKITVPRKGEAISNSQGSINNSTLNNASSGDSNSSKINLNTATESQIEDLDGIGPALAKRIIEYRQSKGGFHSINDLKNVSGIGEKKFAKLKNQVTI